MFKVHRGQEAKSGKKSGKETSAATVSSIAIHPGASAVVCRHTLEVLISLAKSFSAYFLPWKDPSQNVNDADKKKTPTVKCAGAPSGELNFKSVICFYKMFGIHDLTKRNTVFWYS